MKHTYKKKKRKKIRTNDNIYICLLVSGKIIHLSKRSRNPSNWKVGFGRRSLSTSTETKKSSSSSLISFNIERRAKPPIRLLAHLVFLLQFQENKIRSFVLFARTGAKTIRTKTKSEIVAYVVRRYTLKRETLASRLIAWHDGLQSY